MAKKIQARFIGVRCLKDALTLKAGELYSIDTSWMSCEANSAGVPWLGGRLWVGGPAVNAKGFGPTEEKPWVHCALGKTSDEYRMVFQAHV